MTENLEAKFILVAVNEAGEDILPSESEASNPDDGIIVEDGYTCPPVCPKSSPLYGN